MADSDSALSASTDESPAERAPKHFDAAAAEARWDAFWQGEDIYRHDPARPRAERFVIDTPPPTVSGALHIGHVFSYTQTDITARFQRMGGKDVFYPMGWDDNGLPTERRVQNLYHVRCDPSAAPDPTLTLTPASAADRKGRPKRIARADFIDLCQRVTQEDEQAFLSLWRRLGLSVDWHEQYATIDAHSRKLAQLSFLDLFAKGHVEQREAPTMWDVDFQTAVAQAEVEDRPKQGAFHHIRFGVAGEDADFTIATTRPELLPACVGIAAHPDDARYQPLFGKRALTPLFHVPVPIFPSPLADPEKGTGILMVCTFGDATDVQWWREHGLALRQVLGRDGRFVPVDFSAAPFESQRPELAARFYAELCGKTVFSARGAIVQALRQPEGASAGHEAPLSCEPKPVEQAVKFFEKGDRPLEFITTRQWFVRLLPHKAALLAQGEKIQWHPPFMGVRYQNWTENLSLDWCISRQRYFGVPFPLWYPLDEAGQLRFEAPILASEAQLPVDPMASPPPGMQEAQRGQPGGFVGEADVFDTWFTSSLSPQLSSHWGLDQARHARLFPADMRPQSHEIIRTWAFYTIAKAWLHEGQLPWQHVVVSGWVLDPDRKKMSKSKGNVITPLHLLDEHGSDAVRYWAASARLGTDTAFDPKVLKIGRRLVTKLYNAGKFVLQHPAPPDSTLSAIQHPLDQAFVAALRALVTKATADQKAFEFAKALLDTEQFFWRHFTDSYLELSKGRARTGSGPGAHSAILTLRLGLSVLLRLFAPVLPYITEELWSWDFASAGAASIHRAAWPTCAELSAVAPPDHPSCLSLAAAALGAIHKHKSEAGVSIGRPITALTLTLHPDDEAALRAGLPDVLQASRASDATLQSDAAVERGTVTVHSLTLADDSPRT